LAEYKCIKYNSLKHNIIGRIVQYITI
jgi:hypothetical protein